MSKKLAILGCGYLGSELARQALDRGWTVVALTRNANTAASLREAGVSHVVEAELDGISWHGDIDATQDFVVNCVGAASADLAGYAKSYVEGQDSVMQWASNGQVGTYVFTSSSSVYPQTGRRLVDETASCDGVSERGGLLLAAEQFGVLKRWIFAIFIVTALRPIGDVNFRKRNRFAIVEQFRQHPPQLSAAFAF